MGELSKMFKAIQLINGLQKKKEEEMENNLKNLDTTS